MRVMLWNGNPFILLMLIVGVSGKKVMLGA